VSRGGGIGQAFRRHLIAGLVVIAPVGITAFVLWWIFQWLDNLLGRFLYPALGTEIPGLGLVLLVAILLAVGWVAERAVGARVLGLWHSLLERLPLASRIYTAANRIFRTVFTGEDRPFREVALVEYPAPGRWAVGFITGRAPGSTQSESQDRVTVFIPNPPNPATGALAIVPRSQVQILPMTVEEAFTYILSVGVIVPNSEVRPRVSESAEKARL